MQGIIDEVNAALRNIDPDDNRMKFEIAMSVLPREKDQEDFVSYMLGILMNHVDEDTWSYAIGQAYKCWAELNPDLLPFAKGVLQ